MKYAVRGQLAGAAETVPLTDTGRINREPGEFIAVVLPATRCLIWRCREPIRERNYCAAHLREWKAGKQGNSTWAAPRPPCSRPGCKKPNHARGQCKDHYNEEYNEARRKRRAAEAA